MVINNDNSQENPNHRGSWHSANKQKKWKEPFPEKLNKLQSYTLNSTGINSLNSVRLMSKENKICSALDFTYQGLGSRQVKSEKW